MIEGFWFEIEDITFRDSGFNRRAKPFSTPCLANDDSEGTDHGSARLAWRKSTDDVEAKTPTAQHTDDHGRSRLSCTRNQQVSCQIKCPVLLRQRNGCNAKATPSKYQSTAAAYRTAVHALIAGAASNHDGAAVGTRWRVLLIETRNAADACHGRSAPKGLW